MPHKLNKLGQEQSADPLQGYAPPRGVADELMDAQGNVRPVWQNFVKFLSALPGGDIERRIARGDQYLRDAGVFFRQYGQAGSTERAWPLSAIPVLIAETEWTQISKGLVQRAELLEAVMADLYGANTLVESGQLPAALIANSPEWLRPLVGVKPSSGHFLQLIAFEIGRGPNGQWWVLGDRTQAPSGSGFALENRVATARMFTDFYTKSNVHRLAGFFRSFRDELQAMCGEGAGRVAILTPGPLNDTYYEHAYIARYLGFMLLEGEDLTVQNGQVLVRTVAGLRPVSVLWRRLDSAFADPLELNEASSLGTPGLLNAIRHGGVSLVNALGSGVLEMRALLAFLPRICQSLRGEALAMPNVATWWCGQAKERDYVVANAKRMLISPALSTRLPFDVDAHSALGGAFRGETTGSLEDWIAQEAQTLVGQEAVTLSTTPAYIDGRLQPRPMSIRVFLARTAAGWQVMPGGYARIGKTQDATAIAMQQGGSVADVWVVSDHPVETVTMLPAPSAPYVRPDSGALPSRAADNLYWMGRYIERAEGYMRLLRSYHIRLEESGTAETPLLKYLAEYLKPYKIDLDEGVPDTLLQCLGSAVHSASKVRDRFSIDGWMALNDLTKSARRMAETLVPGDDSARAMGVLLRKITGFSGLVHENMYRFLGWRFLIIGRSLERAASMAMVLAAMADANAPDGALDLVVDVADSTMSHRRRYAVSTSRDTVIDLLALDVMNPRSVLYHLTEIRDHVRFLSENSTYGPLSPLSKATLALHTDLAIKTPEALDTKALIDLNKRIEQLSNLLSASYLK